MELRFISVLILLINISGISGKPKKYYMEELCGQTFELQEPSIRLKLSMADYKDNMNCVVTIRACNVSSVHATRLMLVFDDMEIDESSSHCSDGLQIHDGHSLDSPPVPGTKEKLCGSEKPIGPLFTSTEQATFVFVSDAYGNDDGFELFVTPFHKGTCTDSETECNDGQCIGESLQCDGYDQCGDRSDECMWLLAIISSTVCGVSAFVITIVIALCCCRRKVLCCCCCKVHKEQKKPQRVNRIQLASNIQQRLNTSYHPNVPYDSAETNNTVILFPPHQKQIQSTSAAAAYEAHPPSYADVMAAEKKAKYLPSKSHI